MITEMICNLFVCHCSTFHGVKNVRQINDTRIVGRCLKCGKRVYGNFFDNKEFLNINEDKNG